MKKTLKMALALATTAALAGTGLSANAAPKPARVIEDPVGDGNFVNDQGTGDGSFGDQTAADAATVSDITHIDLSNDSKFLYVDIGTEATPPATTGVGFEVRFNGDAPGQCFIVRAFYSGANNLLTKAVGHAEDVCGGGDRIPVEVVGTRVIVPRADFEALAKGAVLTSPQARSFFYFGDENNGAWGGTVDTTKVGEDYKLKDKKKKK